MKRGKFITFEGGEGAGKSTQAHRLAARLEAEGRQVVLTREPGGSTVAERIRDLVLAEKPHEPVAEFLLFAAARAEHLTATIKPALRGGAWVICDRFIDSTRVYQGDAGGIDPALIRLVEQHTVAPWIPDLTLVMDLAPEVGIARARSRGATNRYDEAALTLHTTLRRGFRRIAKEEPGRCVLVDASAGEDAVAHAIWDAVTSRLLAGAH